MSIRRKSDPDKRSDSVPTAALGIGAAALMVVCCAGPALVAGGAIAAAGQFFAGPFFLATGLAVVIVALVLAFGRRHRR